MAVIGYGSQGRVHALNLKDSGCENVRVALRAGSATAKKAEADISADGEEDPSVVAEEAPESAPVAEGGEGESSSGEGNE